jgi:hypothetical protein
VSITIVVVLKIIYAAHHNANALDAKTVKGPYSHSGIHFPVHAWKGKIYHLIRMNMK